MTAFAYVAAVLVIAWAALAVVAHLLNPEQSPLSMGMSGLARGHAPWVMKSAFLCRGGSALVLLIAVPGVIGAAGLALVGVVAFWLWGVGSAALAVVDTDMPGEPPSRAGAAHALVALVAYVAGVVGALALSLALRGESPTSGLGAWALALALAAGVAMAAQFVAFGAAAREARAAGASGRPDAARSAPPSTPASDVPPQLAGAGPSGGQGPAPASGRPGGLSWLSSNSLAGYAGLLQRVFLGLLMAWTLLVALGIGRS